MTVISFHVGLFRTNLINRNLVPFLSSIKLFTAKFLQLNFYVFYYTVFVVGTRCLLQQFYKRKFTLKFVVPTLQEAGYNQASHLKINIA